MNKPYHDYSELLSQTTLQPVYILKSPTHGKINNMKTSRAISIETLRENVLDVRKFNLLTQNITNNLVRNILLKFARGKTYSSADL